MDLFKVNNKDTDFTYCSDISIVDFGQVIVDGKVFCYEILGAK